MKWFGIIYFTLTMMLGSVGYTEAKADSNNELAVTAPDKLKESEIAVNLDSPKKATSTEGSLQKMILAAILFSLCGVGIVVYLKKTVGKNSGKNQTNQIKILSQHHLGPKRSLALVRVAGESMLVGITDTNISLIKALSLMDDEIPEETPADFGGVLNKLNPKEKIETKSESFTEEFSMAGIKDVVSRKLKNMRSIE